jgi:hypothetical protein
MAARRASYLAGTKVFGEPVSILFRRNTLLEALPWNDGLPFLLDVELYTRVPRRGGIVVRLESVGAFRRVAIRVLKLRGAFASAQPD